MVKEISNERLGQIHLESGKLLWDIYSPKFDLKKGFDSLFRAAEVKNPEAMYLVSISYLYGGRGVDKNREEAYKWLKEAADAGIGEAQMLAADIAQEEGDEEAALHWYEEAEKNNVCMADERKRLILIKKHNRNISNTFEWYKEGADLGIAMDCYRIGMAYYKGDGVQPDYELAEKYLIKADNEAGINQELLSETLGDIYAFHLNEPIKALSHYYSMEDGEKILSTKVEEIRSKMGFFEKRKFDKEYKEWLENRKAAEEMIRLQSRSQFD